MLSRSIGDNARRELYGRELRHQCPHAAQQGRPPLYAGRAFRPDIVIIKLGTNDTKPHNWKYGKEFRKDLSALIDSFRCEGNPRIYLCYPATVYGTKWGINDSTIVHGVIPAIKKTARRKKVKIIDLHTPTSGMPENFPDRVHPNANGARILAQTVYQAITSEKKR